MDASQSRKRAKKDQDNEAAEKSSEDPLNASSIEEDDDTKALGHSSSSLGDCIQFASPLRLSKFSIPKQACFGQCRSVTEFEKLNRIGEGTYGIVYRAKDLVTNEIVAIKRVKMTQEVTGSLSGMPIMSLREINLLKKMQHENIVQLKHMAVGKELTSVFLVMEYCEQDLGYLLDNMPCKFSESQVKCLVLQLLKGVGFLHSNFVIHRDLKLSNLLLTAGGILKVADFGLARSFGVPIEAMSPRVVTLWYRAPELLLGQEVYTTAVDCWALGCILGEFLNHSPLFKARTEVQLIEMIAKLLGSPNEAIWPGFKSLPLSASYRFPDQPYNNIRQKFSYLSDTGIELLQDLLTYDPKQRISAKEALKHPYFTTLPFPSAPELLPYFPELRNKRLQQDD